ncbi:uncharacterized protein KY384_006403 [Bacidia gigantensis]|uniref:uncharacterized protein n=1 Tax=Bacidia gigantensis TaxID=2732470 RepID=UPI001D040216|nr:uncharacterized protein KY384_006403 [Bacidia gigantensis]KAG8528716.1 hypothetical protein KY384_006403 [Bacidia gigantensis]
MDDMEMGHTHGSMGSTSGDGVPNLFFLQHMYWAVVGSAIGVAALINITNKALYWQRMTDHGKDAPAKPKNLLFRSYATATAIGREISSSSISLPLPQTWQCLSPLLGCFSLVLADAVLVIVLCFYGLNPGDQWQYEDVGYRTGFIAATQLPLVVLLAGKRNIIGFLVGCSYERLNWLHRWVSRILFLTVSIHMGFWFRSWARYDYITIKLETDPIVQRGFAAWCILLWIFLTSFAPIRRWNYEFFIVQHIVTFIGFLAAVFLHLPAEVKGYVWLPIALYACDRVVRTVFILFNNLSIFHPRRSGNSILVHKGRLEPLSNGASKIVIIDPSFRWQPGQHVFLSCHGIAPLQAHPFTIATLMEDKQLEFIIKSKSGATKHFFEAARKHQGLPTSSTDLSSQYLFPIIIDGPYGTIRPLCQFDSVFLIAGANGGSFTVPLMREIVARRKRQLTPPANGPKGSSIPEAVVTRYIRFIWVMKSKGQYQWASEKINRVFDDVQLLRSEGHLIELDMSIYMTCDVNLDIDIISQRKFSGGVMIGPKVAQRKNIEKTFVVEMEKATYSSSTSSDRSEPTTERTRTKKACGPNGTCCCATTIEDEDAIRHAADRQVCCCCTAKQQANISTNQKHDEKLLQESRLSGEETLTVESDSPMTGFHSSVAVLTGRPYPKILVRTMLEKARGESAVVVCGPQGLNDDVRNAVVALSDERAVHKGTGAQGIYFWAEGFQY